MFTPIEFTIYCGKAPRPDGAGTSGQSCRRYAGRVTPGRHTEIDALATILPFMAPVMDHRSAKRAVRSRVRDEGCEAEG